jgi:hypothetical protein
MMMGGNNAASSCNSDSEEEDSTILNNSQTKTKVMYSFIAKQPNEMSVTRGETKY